MSLRDQLRTILPKILPTDPADPIKGTELVRLAKFQLSQDYSDSTLRYHFSIMSCEPSSPIAKVAQGQGYYLRPQTDIDAISGRLQHLALHQASLADQLNKSTKELNRELLHARKFKVIVERYLENNNRFPCFPISDSDNEAKARSSWQFPQGIIVDYPSVEAGEDGCHLNADTLKRHRLLNAPLFHLTALKLRLNLTLSNHRQDFFQCLAQSDWAHGAELFIAYHVADASLVDALATLGQRFGIGIFSFGLRPSVLDDLPDAQAIRSMQPGEFDALLNRARPHRLTPAAKRSTHLDWNTFDNSHNPFLPHLLQYIEHTLTTHQPTPYQQYLDQQ